MNNRRTLPLIGLLIASFGTSPVWASGGEEVRSARGQTNIQVVLDIPRREEADVLIPRNGHWLYGKILNEAVLLHTAYGPVKIATKNIAGLGLHGGTTSVVTVNNNRLSGFLDEGEFRLRTTDGTEVALEQGQVSKILFRIRDDERTDIPAGRFLLLRNGDFLTGELADTQLILLEGSTETLISPDLLESLTLLDKGRPRARAQLRDRRSLDGDLVTEVIGLTLDLGPEVRIDQDDLLALYGRRGYAPKGVTAGSAVAVRPPGLAASPGADFHFKDRLSDGSEGPEMVMIPLGSYPMGSPGKEPGRSDNERPRHMVTMVRPFAMGRTEVTFEQYDRFCEATGRGRPSDHGWGRGSRPVVDVSWEDANAYAAWLARETGRPYRLPSEAEWERGARAGTVTPYWWGSEIGENRANCLGCGSRWDNRQTAPVASFEDNLFGLFDTVGNVLEWTADCWHVSYIGAPTDGTAWDKDACRQRVIRGGAWNLVPRFLRAAVRNGVAPESRVLYLGFRLARDL